MSRYIFTGDVCHPDRVVVEANSISEAEKKVDEGDFEVYEESGKLLRFDSNGEDPVVEEAL